jgi:hypothetical protein
VADEETVDMDERRDPPPEPGTRPALIASGTSKLSPVQQAWGAYADHATHCLQCRDIDAERCQIAEQLHRAYEALSDDAFRELRHGRT